MILERTFTTKEERGTSMNWEALLSTQKLGNDEKEPEEFSRYPMNEFEKDYNKIVSSSAFRLSLIHI